jgi:hypothetical protein
VNPNDAVLVDDWTNIPYYPMKNEKIEVDETHVIIPNVINMPQQPNQHLQTASKPQPNQHLQTASKPQPNQHLQTASKPQPQQIKQQNKRQLLLFNNGKLFIK